MDESSDPPDILADLEWVRRLASTIVADRASVDDVVQEAVLAALSARSGAESGARGRGIRPWLGGVVRNLHRGRMRSDANRVDRERRSARSEAVPSVTDLEERAEQSKAVVAAVLELPEAEREVVLLRHFEDLTPKEIGQRLDVPASSVRARLTRAHTRLRKRLEHPHDGGRALALALLPLADPRELAVAKPLVASTITASIPIAMTAKTSFIALVLIAIIGGSVFVTTRGPGATSATDATSARSVAPAVWSANSPSGLAGVDADEVRVSVLGDAAAAAGHGATVSTLTAQECCIVGEVISAEGPAVDARVTLKEIISRRSSGLGVLNERVPRTDKSTTDARGRFRFEVDPRRPYRVVVEDDLHAPGIVTRAFAGDLCRIELTAGHALEILVLDDTGSSLPGVACGLRSGASEWRRAGVTDETGRVLFECLGVGPVKVWASAPDESFVTARRSLQLDPGLTSEELRLLPAAILAGQTRGAESDEAIAGVEIRVNGRTTTSDVRGEFRIGGFLPGAAGVHVLEATMTGYRPAAMELQSPARAGEFRRTVRLTKGLRARIRVVDVNGVGIAGAKVQTYVSVPSSQFSGATIERMSYSDATGLVRLKGIAPDAPVRILATALGYGAGVHVATPDVANVEPGVDANLGQIVLSAPGRIAGRVHESLGYEGLVLLERANGDGEMIVASVDPGRAGEFEFEGLATGRWRLAYHDHGDGGWAIAEPALCFQTIDLAPGEARTSVLLRPGRELRGRVLDPDRSGVSRLLVSATGTGGETTESWTDEAGTFALPAPGDDPYSVEVFDLGLNFERWFEEDVQFDDELEITLTPLETEHVITGRLVTPTGDPLPEGVYVHFTHVPSKRGLMRVAIPESTGWFTMKNLDPVEYHLSLVDFDQRYEAIELKGVTPGGDAVELVLEPRRD